MFVRMTLRLLRLRSSQACQSLPRQLCTSSRCFAQDAPNSSQAKSAPWTASVVVDEDAADIFVGKLLENRGRKVEKDVPQWVKSEAQRAFFHAENVVQLQEVLHVYPKLEHTDASSFLSRLVALSSVPAVSASVQKEARRMAKEWLVSTNYQDGFAESLCSSSQAPLESVVSALNALTALYLEDKVHSQLLATFQDAVKNCTKAPISPIIAFAVCHRMNKTKLSDQLQAMLDHALYTKLSEVSSPADLLSLLIHVQLPSVDQPTWLQALEAKALELLPAMNAGELVSLVSIIANFAKVKPRNIPLLQNVVTNLKRHTKPLTINQLVTLVVSAGKIAFLDPRLLMRVTADLKVRADEIGKWTQMASLTSGLAQLRMGDTATWQLLVDWMERHLQDAKPGELSISASALARCNVTGPAMKKIGTHLAKILDPKLTANARTWLNAVHSLAVMGCLTPKLAESTLIEDFLTELLGSVDKAAAADYKTSVAFDIRQKLMQINSAAQLDLVDYRGPLLAKNDRRFIFSDTCAEEVSQLKYGKNMNFTSKQLRSAINAFAPMKTHSQPPQVTADGVVVDAVLSVDSGDRFLPTSDWQKGQKVAVTLWGYPHRTLMINDDTPTFLGHFALGLRHLKKRGYAIVQVFDFEFDAQKLFNQKVEFIQKKLVAAVREEQSKKQ
uniref:RAP domain-containing protein n=1 Tax=Plectus sambesii TaxID=2011161 RepID=A0A914W2C7_9BILA